MLELAHATPGRTVTGRLGLSALPIGALLFPLDPDGPYVAVLRVADMGSCWTVTGYSRTYGTSDLLSRFGQHWQVVGARPED